MMTREHSRKVRLAGVTAKTSLNSKREAYRLLLEQSVQVLVKRLRDLEGVQRISVFGSFARGRRDLFTDLDVLVLMDTEMSLVDRLRFLYSSLALPVDLDILCYTPREFDSLKASGWLAGILRDEQLMYEK